MVSRSRGVASCPCSLVRDQGAGPERCGKPLRSVKTGLRRAVVDAGLESVTPSVLRPAAAVHLAAANVPMLKISQLLGDTRMAVTERSSARYAPDHMRDKAEFLDFPRVGVAADRGGT